MRGDLDYRYGPSDRRRYAAMARAETAKQPPMTPDECARVREILSADYVPINPLPSRNGERRACGD